MSIGRILIFLTVVLGVSGLLHYYLWTRLVRDVEWPPPYHRAGLLVMVVLAALPLASMIVMRFAPRRVASPIAWIGMSWLGLLFFLFVVLLSFDLARAIAIRLSAPQSDERRLFFARVLGGTAAFLGVGLAAGGAASALSKVAIKEIAVPLARWSASLGGFTIVQLTDIHVGPTIGRAFIEDLVRRTNALSPDLVVITGDLVDGSVAELGDAVRPLAGLLAKHGVFFVTGNHEYYSGVDEWLSFLTSLGIRVLRNERVAIGGESGFDLVGIDDYRAKDFGNGHGADLKKALVGRDHERAMVLLAHQPKAIHEAADAGIDLQLSGHTHGGQLFPFNYLVGLDQPIVAGLVKVKETFIYVSRGTGYWGPPMRLGAPAEITRISLSRA